MANWFECKVKYYKMSENGATKNVTEPFLVDALSFTEAEARITEERAPYMSGEYTVTAVSKRSKISEVFPDDTADKWYLAKVAFVSINEKTGVEKRSITEMLVAGKDFKGAYDNLMDGMKTTLADFEVVSIAETKIMDIYPAK